MELHTRPPVRLNIGAGNKRYPGWLSVGLDDDHDIRTDIRRLPLPDGFADEAMAIHVVEHLERWDVPCALREWRRVLKPGAMLAVELPDLFKCCNNVLTSPEARLGILGLFGDPATRDPMMMHRWSWSPPELIRELDAAGFRKIKQVRPEYHGQRNNRDMRIEAIA